MKKPAPRPGSAFSRRGFITTRWSLVLAAGDGAAPEARNARSELYKLYAPPLYFFLRRQGHPEDEAKEITQGFFARLLEKKDLAAVDPCRGRFRSWLLTALQSHAKNQRAREHAKKRGGGQLLLELDEAEKHFRQDSAPQLSPARTYERRWALALLENVLKTLREEYVERGKELLFEKLKGTLTGEREDPYQRIAEELAMTVDAVKVSVHRLRQRYGDLIREQISLTVAPEDVDDELRFLISALSLE